MAVVYVVPSLVSGQYKNKDIEEAFKGPVPVDEIAEMVKAYRERIRDVSKATVQSPNSPKFEADEEYLALILERPSIELLLKQTGSGDLVALFALEKAGDKHRNTIILMALAQGTKELLRDNDGEFSKAEETWPGRLAVNAPDTEFEQFFKRPTL